MTDSDGSQVHEESGRPGGVAVDDRGWYLYGIIRSDGPIARGAGNTLGGSTVRASPLEIVAEGGVAAVVRLVPLSDFDLDAHALQERGRDRAWLEAMLSGHNEVITLIHQRQGILPARFGSVYASIDDLRSALADTTGELIAQLDGIDGRDEWAVHLYAERRRLAEGGASDPRVRHLEEQIASARPGRAYFLRRQLEEERSAASDRAAAALAETAYERLARHAVAETVSAPQRGAQRSADEAEILRAAFLVARDAEERFHEEVLHLEEEEGVRAELTGPWPPYSFVTLPDLTP